MLDSWAQAGGVPRAQACMDMFKMTLEECELHDCGGGDGHTKQTTTGACILGVLVRECASCDVLNFCEVLLYIVYISNWSRDSQN